MIYTLCPFCLPILSVIGELLNDQDLSVYLIFDHEYLSPLPVKNRLSDPGEHGVPFYRLLPAGSDSSQSKSLPSLC